MSNEGIVGDGFIPLPPEGFINTPEEDTFPEPRLAAEIGQLSLAEQVELLREVEDLRRENRVLEDEYNRLENERRRLVKDGEIKDVVIDDLVQTMNTLNDSLRIAHIDSLTGIPNRSEFYRFANAVDNKAPGREKPYDEETQILLIGITDIDKFKPINDAFGHDVGDALIKSNAQSQQAAIRTVNKDFIVRWGGDENVFCIIINKDKITPENPIELVIEKIKQRFREQVILGITDKETVLSKNPAINAAAKSAFSGISIGIAVHNPDEVVHDTLKRADEELLAEKESKK